MCRVSWRNIGHGAYGVSVAVGVGEGPVGVEVGVRVIVGVRVTVGVRVRVGVRVGVPVLVGVGEIVGVCVGPVGVGEISVRAYILLSYDPT